MAVGDWYVYSDDEEPRGPYDAEALARAIRSGDLPRDVRVAEERWFEAVGASGWRHVTDVPELATALAQAWNSDVPFRLVDGAFTKDLRGAPDFGDSVLMVPKLTRP
jgi:hypothetical protein